MAVLITGGMGVLGSMVTDLEAGVRDYVTTMERLGLAPAPSD